MSASDSRPIRAATLVLVGSLHRGEFRPTEDSAPPVQAWEHDLWFGEGRNQVSRTHTLSPSLGDPGPIPKEYDHEPLSMADVSCRGRTGLRIRLLHEKGVLSYAHDSNFGRAVTPFRKHIKRLAF